jgi:hypothetical protein
MFVIPAEAGIQRGAKLELSFVKSASSSRLLEHDLYRAASLPRILNSDS